MDKSFLAFMAIGIGAMYLLINFMGDIQESDKRLENKDHKKEHMYDKYKTTDSIGQEVLDLTGATKEVQFGAWNESLLKEEFLELFPAFDEMRFFIKDRLRGEELITELTSTIDTIEDKFFSGTMNAEQAKRMLSSLK